MAEYMGESLTHECQWHRLYTQAREQHTTLLLERNALLVRVAALERYIREQDRWCENCCKDKAFNHECFRDDPLDIDAALAGSDPVAPDAGGGVGE